MEEKRKKEEMLRFENKIYDELIRRDGEFRLKKEIEALKKKEDMNNARMTYLNWQRDLRED